LRLIVHFTAAMFPSRDISFRRFAKFCYDDKIHLINLHSHFDMSAVSRQPGLSLSSEIHRRLRRNRRVSVFLPHCLSVSPSHCVSYFLSLCLSVAISLSSASLRSCLTARPLRCSAVCTYGLYYGGRFSPLCDGARWRYCPTLRSE
jgi:hypothetical protein